jgi:putative pyruvate formate lyase activating enzyme
MAMQSYIPGYIRARQTGRLKQAIQQALNLLSSCTLCPRRCRVDRTRDEKGYCSTGKKAVVASFSPHFGEEPPLVGDNGSGTLFFSHCSLKCVFCQNHDISVSGAGQKTDPEQIAAIMLHLQQAGCHNINLVTPTHVNLMSQYRPMGDAAQFPDLAAPLTAKEFKTALQMGKDAGLKLIR